MAAGLDTLLTVLSFGRNTDSPAPGIPVREMQLADGDRGARQMVRIMAREARAALLKPLTIRAAEQIIPPGVNTADKAFFLREWLAQRFQFFPDPHGMELLRTPDFLLTTIIQEGIARGDCDDAATLAAALALAAGLRTRFVLVSFGATLPYSHVFSEVFTDCQGWVELDITRPAQVAPGVRFIRHETREV